ncbi:MAG: hypothetical protein Q9177_002097 [Variospora cf. flavescens]
MLEMHNGVNKACYELVDLPEICRGSATCATLIKIFPIENANGPDKLLWSLHRALLTMATEQSFDELKAGISSALISTTRTAAQISNEDLAFQRSINPEVDRLLNEQNARLLALVRDLTRSATAGTDTIPPPLKDVESVDDGWRGIVDVIDHLLEKADACLDEFTGVIKKLTPAHRQEAAVADAKRPLARHEYRNQNILKPQRLFRRVPTNDEASPFKPLLTSKPNAIVPLDESLVTTPQPDGSIQYKHPYEAEIYASRYPELAYAQRTPIPYLPFDATSATWVDTPEGVQAMLQDLKGATEIAVDVEHHDMHTYVGIVSLLQISTRDRDWIVDTLVPWREDLQILNEVFTEPRIVKVLHGSTSDIVWLQRDLGLYIVGLFDTYHASRLLGYPKHSLAYLLHHHAAFEADKRYQMADWRMRPLPKQMYDYARSDTHFLLYIFDKMRNELLAKTNAASAAGHLVDEVCQLSKAEALQRYERYFYDVKTGMGATGWRNMLLRSPERLDRQQFAILRAVHEWRDKIAREEDESVQQILTNRAIFVIAREMPTEMPQLLSYCQPSHMATKKRVSELLHSIKSAMAEGVNGPEMQDLIVPHGRPDAIDPAPLRSIATNPATKLAPGLSRRSAIVGPASAAYSAILNASRFWGATVDRETQDVQNNPSIRRSEPYLALPLPPLTAQVFETKTTDEPSAPTPLTIDPGARAEHKYSKKRRPEEEDVFVLTQSGSKKRKTNEAQEGAELAAINHMGSSEDRAADGEAGRDEVALVEEQGNEGGLTKSQRRQQRKRKLREERQKPSNGDEVGKRENGDTEAFDYENPAYSVLHARKRNGGAGVVKRGMEPYSKSLDAPKGMRKMQKEVPGRIMPPASRASTSSSSSYLPMSRQNTISSYDGRSARQSKRYSTALYLSMNAKEKDLEIEDDLARAQKIQREYKAKISSQSKKNFVLEKDVRYLDSRIALLIQNRMALEEQNEVASHLEDATDLQEGFFPNDEKTQKYGNLLFLLQSEPRHIAHLCRLVTMTEIDSLLQTVMFTIYGNQYESREEHLLLTMFQSVLTYQFDHTLEYSSLLRANTPVSRMMTTYTRRGPGQSYLKVVLQEKINSLIELKDVDLEVNPLKVYGSMIAQIEQDTGSVPEYLPRAVTAEQAAENKQVQAIIAPRLTMLMEIASSFLETIIEGLDETPYGIRWICKQIRSLSKRKYPDAKDQTICTLIGGFFFLRFINPAIVTPRSYMLIDDTPSEHPRRTLTLVAKILQNLANKPSYTKEPHMAKLQPFIERNKDRVNRFMLDLCEVQDFYESLEMDNYVALSKKDLELSITLNEVYATHALLEKHSAALARDDNSHLNVILQELGPAPAQLPRKENRAINLPLFSKWETAIDDMTQALDITQEEVFFMEAKATFVQIMRSLPPSSSVARRPLRLDRVAEAAATLKNDAVMVRKGIRTMELLSQLQELGVIDKSDGFALLRDEVEQELVHLGSLKEKVLEETKKLEEVFRTIRDHNSYLVGQLETYKSYLHNVRSQSEGKQRKQQKQQVLGPYKFTHQQLEKEGVIQKSNVPDNRRANIFFNFISPLPGTFVISLHYKGRNRGLLELDLKLDDLLEMQKDNQEALDLEYVQFNVPKVLALLNKRFARKKGW